MHSFRAWVLHCNGTSTTTEAAGVGAYVSVSVSVCKPCFLLRTHLPDLERKTHSQCPTLQASDIV